MQEERYGERDGSYSAWHRRRSTGRFVGIELAQSLAMIDLDVVVYVEVDERTRRPVALIETAVDVGQENKSGSFTAELARMARIPAYVVLYKLASTPNPFDGRWPDIESFRVKRLVGAPTDDVWRDKTPAEWCDELLELRKRAGARIDQELGLRQGA